MREVQHLALDKDKWANELVEEALADYSRSIAVSGKSRGIPLPCGMTGLTIEM
jgi:hypothetical protein